MAAASGPIPTQVLHPWRTVLRTGVQVAVALLTLVPYVVTEAQIPVAGVFAQVLAVAVTLTKIMALPGVVMFLRKFAPWLAPDGGIQTPTGHDEGPHNEAEAHDGGAGDQGSSSSRPSGGPLSPGSYDRW